MPHPDAATELMLETDASQSQDSRPARQSFLRANLVTLVAGAVAVALAATVYFGMAQGREISSVWVLLAKLTPFVAASIAIGWLDRDWAARLRLPLILPPLTFLVFFCYFVPKIFFYSDGPFDKLYYTVLILVPFIILSLVLAMRLGGASTSTVLRLAAAMILLQLSGIEDLAFLTVNDLSGTPYSPIPEVWTWADHITVFLGHPASKYEAYAFIVGHLVLAVLVLAVPGRWLRSLRRRRRADQPAS
ncbi:MAG TPA: hypothetical protein VF163_05665 [Micromonosporaceae bacterium]